MSSKHLWTKPHKVTNDFWWYEENQGVAVCVSFKTAGGECIQEVRYIPWRAIRAALKRKDKK